MLEIGVSAGNYRGESKDCTELKLVGVSVGHVFPIVMAGVGKGKGVWKKIDMCGGRCKDP